MVFTATVAGGATIRMGDDLRQFVVRKLVEPGTCRCCQQTFEPQAEAGLRTVVCAECFPNLSRVVQATMRRDYRTWVSQTEIDKE